MFYLKKFVNNITHNLVIYINFTIWISQIMPGTLVFAQRLCEMEMIIKIQRIRNESSYTQYIMTAFVVTR